MSRLLLPLLPLVLVHCGVAFDGRPPGDGGSPPDGSGGGGAAATGGGTTADGGASMSAGGSGGASPVCGNGTIESGEECDDGDDSAPGDGCHDCVMSCATDLAGAIVMKDPSSHHCYIAHPDLLQNRDQTISLCQGWHADAHLPAITSEEENTFINEQLVAAGQEFLFLFMGGTDFELDGTWVWDTGEPFVYDDWGPGEPALVDNGDDADCAIRTGSGWRARPWFYGNHLFCEWEPPGG